MPKPDLDAAYALGGTAETLEFYKDWAESYDQTFAEDRGYRSPAEVARRFLAAAQGNEPVLDIGAGTGLIGQALADVTIDALDLSPEMLAVAKRKGVYRNLITADQMPYRLAFDEPNVEGLDLDTGDYADDGDLEMTVAIPGELDEAGISGRGRSRPWAC